MTGVQTCALPICLSGSLSCAYYAKTDSSYVTPLSISNSTAAGTYVVHCSGSAASGYATPNINDGTLTIVNTPWTIVSNNASYTVGGTLPTFSGSASPSAALSGSLSCSAYVNSDIYYSTALTINQYLSEGTYAIHCTGSAATGYVATPSFSDGTLTVTALKTWTINATSATFTRPGSAPSAAGTVSDSNGLSGSLSCSFYSNSDTSYSTPLTISNTTSNGTYTIHCTGSTAAGYAAPSNNNAVLTVSSSNYTITTSTDSHSSITATASIGYGLSQDISISANTGYTISAIIVDSVALSGSSDRKSTRLNSSHIPLSRMPSSA